MFTLAGWIVFGWIAGTLALWLVPPAKPVAGWQTAAIGAAGSVLGGMVSAILSGDYYAPGGFFWSIGGAVAVVFAWRWYTEAP